MRLLIVGDVHLADRPPSMRTENYTDEVFAKLAECNALAAEHGVDAVVQAGDLFHIKAPSRNSHRMVHRFITDVMEPAPVPWWVVPGNHDMTHDRLSSLPNQPLGVLFEAGLNRLMGECEIGDGVVYGVPYLQEWAELPEVWGTAWREGPAGLCVAHASIFPNDDRPLFEHFSADEWEEDMGVPDAFPGAHVYFGHIHDRYGTFTSSSGKTLFCNQGALTRGSLAEHDVKREVAVTLYDDQQDIPFEAIPLKSVKPASEVFRMAQHEAEQNRAVRLDEFLSQVNETELGQVSVESVLAEVAANTAIGEDTRREIRECLEEAMNA